MKIYTATATREGKYWVLDVEGVGVTQSRSLKEAHAMISSLVSLVLQVPEGSFGTSVVAALEPEVDKEVADAKAAIAALDQQQRDAARRSRRAVERLKRSGLTGADTAAVLGISAQRVSQLAPKKAGAASKPAAKSRMTTR